VFEEFVKENRELVERAQDLGIDVKVCFETILKKYGDRYSRKTVFARARAQLRREIQEKSAVKVKGIITGSRDRFGKPWPIRLAVVQKNQSIEISTWSIEHVRHGDHEISLPIPCVAELSIQQDEQYGSYQLVSVEAFKPVDREFVVEKLLQVARTPSELDENELYKVIVVKGIIDSVHPATKFEEGKPTGTFPVLTEDAREEKNLWPTMQIWLKPDQAARCRLILDRPRYAKPCYIVDDLQAMCEDAMALKDHVEQCKYVQDGIEGRKVIAVGIVTNYYKTRLASSDVDYIDIGVSGLYEIDVEQVTDEAKEKESETKEEEHAYVQQQALPKQNIKIFHDDEGNLEVFHEYGSNLERVHDEESKAKNDLEKVKHFVRAYCRALNLSFHKINEGIVIEKIGIRNVPISVIRTAIQQLREEK